MIDSLPARHWFMHTPHAAVGLAAPAEVSAGQPPRPIITPQSPELPRETRTLRVGLVAGPEAMWAGTQYSGSAAACVAEHLRQDQSFAVYHAWDCVDLGLEDPTDYDCLVLLGWPAASNRQRIKRIELFCRGGGSLVALRAMQAEIPGWSNFAEEVLGGRQPVGQRCRLMEVQRSDSAWHHPIVEGVETLIAEGEVYCGPRFSPDTSVLLTAENSRGVQPVAWTKRHAGGRIFCTTLGLDDDFREPSFLRLISNAVHWAGLVHG